MHKKKIAHPAARTIQLITRRVGMARLDRSSSTPATGSRQRCRHAVACLARRSIGKLSEPGPARQERCLGPQPTRSQDPQVAATESHPGVRHHTRQVTAPRSQPEPRLPY
jgi:hypothetical protein